MRASRWTAFILVVAVARVGAQAPNPTEAQKKLGSSDPAVVAAGLTELAAIGGDGPALAVANRLKQGLPPQLTEAAIDALRGMARPAAAPVLLELRFHHRPAIRAAALAGLGELRQRSAQPALLAGLDDPSSEVRSAAVRALAQAGDARALPALFSAAERGMPGSWEAIGQLASAADFKRLLGHASGADVSPLRPALDALIARPNLPADAKLRLVQQLTQLASPSVRACLSEWLAAYKPGVPPRLRSSLEDSLRRLDAEPASQSASATPAPVAPAASKTSAAAKSGDRPRAVLAGLNGAEREESDE